jgi:hypothetical protein
LVCKGRSAKQRSEASTSFLKKRSKKLLDPGLSLSGEARLNVQKFFGSFFQKRTSLLLERVAGPYQA